MILFSTPPYFLEPIGGPFSLKLGQKWSLSLPTFEDSMG